nr:MAG TPA_asm: hypothetical protein [Caudoviricetes sp.]
MTKAHFFLTRAVIFEKFWVKIGHFGQICGQMPGFCPLLKPHFGQKKPSIYAGLRAFCPLSHF